MVSVAVHLTIVFTLLGGISHSCRYSIVLQ